MPAPEITPPPRINGDYARVSEDDRGAAEGVESQHEECVQFGDEIGRPVTASYQDNSLSAFTGRARPEFERLLADVDGGVLAAVIIWHADRLTRDVGEALKIIELFREHKVRLYSVQKGGEYLLTRASGRAEFISDINAAARESGHKGERITLARKRQARTGAYGGGVRPFGWGAPTGRVRSKCINPKAPLDEREYVDVPVLDMGKHRKDEAQEIRRWARELLATRGNVTQLLASIRERGVLTVSEADERTVKYRGKKAKHAGWRSVTVRKIVTSPRVSGHSVHQGVIIKWNAWPAILPEETRQALITLLDDPSRMTSPGNTPKWLVSHSPGATCGQCDADSVVTVRHNSRGAIYRCDVCGRGNQPTEEVDEYLAAVACERLSRPDLTELIAPPRPGVDVAALRDDIAALQQQKTEASLAYARRSIDLSMLETVKAECDKQISTSRTQLAEAASDSPLVDFLDARSMEAVTKLWRSKSIGQRREIVRLLMDVVVLKGDPDRLDPDTLLITPKRAAEDISRA